MKNILTGLAILFSLTPLLSQNIQSLDGKWAFSGSRTTVFTVKNDILYVSTINDSDIANFETFYSGKPITDSTQLFEAKTKSFNGKLMITAELRRNKETSLMAYIYDEKDSTHLKFIGDVYYGEKKFPYTNAYCDTLVPYCSSRLYNRAELLAIKKLKSLATISKAEVLVLFRKHENVCKTKCNKCYEGFPGAEINELLIEMGYNPINKEKQNSSYKYEASGFDFIMDLYKDDPEIKAAYTNYFSVFINGE